MLRVLEIYEVEAANQAVNGETKVSYALLIEWYSGEIYMRLVAFPEENITCDENVVAEKLMKWKIFST